MGPPGGYIGCLVNVLAWCWLQLKKFLESKKIGLIIQKNPKPLFIFGCFFRGKFIALLFDAFLKAATIRLEFFKLWPLNAYLNKRILGYNSLAISELRPLNLSSCLNSYLLVLIYAYVLLSCLFLALCVLCLVFVLGLSFSLVAA